MTGFAVISAVILSIATSDTRGKETGLTLFVGDSVLVVGGQGGILPAFRVVPDSNGYCHSRSTNQDSIPTVTAYLHYVFSRVHKRFGGDISGIDTVRVYIDESQSRRVDAGCVLDILRAERFTLLSVNKVEHRAFDLLAAADARRTEGDTSRSSVLLMYDPAHQIYRVKETRPSPRVHENPPRYAVGRFVAGDYVSVELTTIHVLWARMRAEPIGIDSLSDSVDSATVRAVHDVTFRYLQPVFYRFIAYRNGAALRRPQPISGTLSLKFRINPDRHVSHAVVIENNTGSDDLAECVRKYFATRRYRSLNAPSLLVILEMVFNPNESTNTYKTARPYRDYIREFHRKYPKERL